MNANNLIVFLLNVVLLSIGLGLGFFLSISVQPLLFVPTLWGGVVVALSFFVLSLAFFGYITPLLFLYFGISMSSVLTQNPAGLIVYSLTALVASSSGNILGEAMQKEMNSKEKKPLDRQAIMFLGLSVILGIAAGFIFQAHIPIVLPAMPSFT